MKRCNSQFQKFQTTNESRWTKSMLKARIHRHTTIFIGAYHKWEHTVLHNYLTKYVGNIRSIVYKFEKLKSKIKMFALILHRALCLFCYIFCSFNCICNLLLVLGFWYLCICKFCSECISFFFDFFFGVWTIDWSISLDDEHSIYAMFTKWMPFTIWYMIIINDLPYGLKRMPVTVQPHDRDTNIYVLLYSHNNKSGSMRTQNSYHEEYRTTILII